MESMILPRFVPELAIPVSEDGTRILAAQLCGSAGKACVRTAIYVNGEMKKPTKLSVLRFDAEKNLYFFVLEGVEFILNNFKPVTVEVKDPDGNVIGRIPAGENHVMENVIPE